MENHTILRRELVTVALQCNRRGLQTGNGGNLSARIPGENLMLVKASELSFSSCVEESLVVADFDGNLVEGSRKPSRESLLHGAIYRKLPRVQAIVHCHSPWATGWASTGRPLPFATHHSEIKFKGEVRTFDTGSYAVPSCFFPELLDVFEEFPELAAFLLKGHGQVALGKTVMDALYTAELVEETAHIAVVEKILASVDIS